jgi:enoyl-CoA hydratase
MIDRENVDGVAVVRLNHGKVNALDVELLQAITDTFTALDGSPEKAVVVTGAGRAFSAGVDLWRIIEGGPDYVDAFLPALSDAFLAVFGVGKPIVAAVNGHAIAGGAVLACACDRRLMADTGGRIGVTELDVGVPFPSAALEILAFAMGERPARDAIVAADTHSAREAVERGYVDELVAADALVDTAVGVAAGLADRIPADTYRLTKAQFQRRTRDRLETLRPAYDPEVRALWIRRVEDGSLRRYMEQVTARR